MFKTVSGIRPGTVGSIVVYGPKTPHRLLQANGPKLARNAIRKNWRFYSTTKAADNGFNAPKRSGNKGGFFMRLGGVILGIGVTGYVWDRHWNSSTLTRSIRALSTMLIVGIKYHYIDSYKNADQLHEIASEALYQMLMKNKGIYIKFGQAIANQGSVFPPAFQERFVKLYDEAPCDTWESVDKTLKQSLGNDYETRVFKNIDHEPIASASIAQVHKATLINGDEVAVKVQHDYISAQVAADLLCYQIAVKFYEKVFQIPMSFYTKYISDQTLLETKFVHELENAERLRSFIANDSSVRNLNVYIPKNYKELSSEKVLISEWINGISLTKRKLLIESGYNISTIMNQFITIFGKQIFKYGFIHSDPHPGNMLVRMHNGKQQLVILDHGLYVELREKFRLEYSQFWKYLFSFDQQGIRRIGQEWGVNSIEMFASSIQLKPIKIEEENKPKDRREMITNFLSDTTKFPLELFFLGRTMRIIQNCNKTFGSPVNRINVLTNEALNSLIRESGFREFVKILTLKTSLFISSVIFIFFRIRQILKGDKYGLKHQGLEDEIERYFKNMAKEMGVEIPEDSELEQLQVD